METNNFYGNGVPVDPNNPYMYGQYPYAPVTYANVPLPLNQNALTEDEIKQMLGTKSKRIDLTLDPVEVLRQCCTHKRNGNDMVQRTIDGKCYCPLCNEVWRPIHVDEDEVKENLDRVNDMFQTAKWLGDLPVEMTREYFPMGGLLKKFPEIYKYAMENFNRNFNNNSYAQAQDASVYSMFNSLISGGYNNPFAGYAQGVAPMPNMYQQPGAVQPQMAGQPMAMGYQPQNAAQPVAAPGQPQFYYNPAQAGQPVPTNNPMDISSYGYGVNPAAPNQQFVAQAANMVPGGVPAPQFGAIPAIYQPQPQAAATQPATPATAATPTPTGEVTKTEQVNV